MKIPIRAIIFLIVLIFIKSTLNYRNEFLESLIGLLIWVDVIYIIYKIVVPANAKKEAKYNAPINPTPNITVLPKKKSVGNNIITIAAIVFIIIIILKIGYLSTVATNFFVLGDRLFSNEPSGYLPIFAWVIIGALIGLCIGALVAWKKYKLHYRLIIYPVLLLIGVFLILFKLNKPLDKINGVGINNFLDNTENNKKTNAIPAYDFVKASASSNLPAYKDITYGIDNVIDKNDNTVWIENSTYAGIGETIDFTFNKMLLNDYRQIKCVGFKIKNGYVKSNKLWVEFNRLKEFNVYLNGTFKCTAKANNDTYNQWEEISINPININYNDDLQISISNVYYGIKKDMTAISEFIPLVEFEKI